ncbi:unnamed protein product [Amoebophrya sp. A120]|nr:unnamed protein product [Amoebophrya sp. A120]|eukprot:GSA120T00024561001.1
MLADSSFDDPEFTTVTLSGQRYRKVLLPDHVLDLHPVKLGRGGKHGEEDDEERGHYYTDEDSDYENDSNVFNDSEDEGRWEFLEVEDKYEYRLPVPQVYFKFLIGANHKTLKKMEQDTGCEILCKEGQAPVGKMTNAKTGDEIDGHVAIRARDKMSLKAGKGAVEYTMELAEQKIPMTHFFNVRIPANSIVPTKFQQWLDTKQCVELNPHYFQKPERLHFTLLPLKLHTKEKIEKVKQIIRELNASDWFPDAVERFRLDLKGLHYMNDEPGKVNVLYTEPSTGAGGASSASATTSSSASSSHSQRPPNPLNHLVDILFQILIKNDIVTKEYLMQQRLLDSTGKNADIKPHCTLLNTKFYVQYMERTGKWSSAKAFEEENENPRFINAKPLLQANVGYDFGSFEAVEVEFSDMLEIDRNTQYFKKLAGLKLG